jgi:hypothetical protein
LTLAEAKLLYKKIVEKYHEKRAFASQLEVPNLAQIYSNEMAKAQSVLSTAK